MSEAARECHPSQELDATACSCLEPDDGPLVRHAQTNSVVAPIFYPPRTNAGREQGSLLLSASGRPRVCGDDSALFGLGYRHQSLLSSAAQQDSFLGDPKVPYDLTHRLQLAVFIATMLVVLPRRRPDATLSPNCCSSFSWNSIVAHRREIALPLDEGLHFSIHESS